MSLLRPVFTTALPVILLLSVLVTFPDTIRAQTATPCPAPNSCTCTAALLLATLSPIPGTLLPPVAWTPVTDILPVISGLLDRPPPSADREVSFLREIESATDAMFASQFAAHTVANNARIAWSRSKALVEQIRDGTCDRIPMLGEAPTADVFAKRYPPTRTLVTTLISYEALRTVIKPYKRALAKTEKIFTNFSRNEDVETAVEATVKLLEDIVASGFNKTIVEEKFVELDELDLNTVFKKFVLGWYRARKNSERPFFQAVADQVEPLKRPSICRTGPVNNVTCAICA